MTITIRRDHTVSRAGATPGERLTLHVRPSETKSFGGRGRHGVPALVVRFVLAGVVALVALAVASVIASRRSGTDEAVRDAITAPACSPRPCSSRT